MQSAFGEFGQPTAPLNTLASEYISKRPEFFISIEINCFLLFSVISRSIHI